ncbi:hypothetical protein JKP88DRAFT_317358 [Tribonema minus]|uniref:Uncharacterized protein n=1 Tax=Tribonema minus TaxID=303371 RepID=A0A836CGJ3_9STRA|nr:hypothetical protein JKP88DRAFT_317358 [Tribonema minus]
MATAIRDATLFACEPNEVAKRVQDAFRTAGCPVLIKSGARKGTACGGGVTFNAISSRCTCTRIPSHSARADVEPFGAFIRSVIEAIPEEDMDEIRAAEEEELEGRRIADEAAKHHTADERAKRLADAECAALGIEAGAFHVRPEGIAPEGRSWSFHLGEWVTPSANLELFNIGVNTAARHCRRIQGECVTADFPEDLIREYGSAKLWCVDSLRDVSAHASRDGGVLMTFSHSKVFDLHDLSKRLNMFAEYADDVDDDDEYYQIAPVQPKLRQFHRTSGTMKHVIAPGLRGMTPLRTTASQGDVLPPADDAQGAARDDTLAYAERADDYKAEANDSVAVEAGLRGDAAEVQGNAESAEAQGDVEPVEVQGDVEADEVQGDAEVTAEVHGDAEPTVEVHGDGERAAEVQGVAEPTVDAQGDKESVEAQDDVESVEAQGDAEPIAEVQGDAEPTVEVQGDAEPQVEVHGDAERAAEVQGVAEPTVDAEGDEESVEAQDDAEPIAEVQGDAEPTVEVHGDAEPAAEVQGDAEAQVNVEPAEAQGDAESAEAKGDAEPAEAQGDAALSTAPIIVEMTEVKTPQAADAEASTEAGSS